VPQVCAKDIVESFLQVAGNNSASRSSSCLGKFDELFASARYCNAKIKSRDKALVTGTWHRLGHHHEGSYADKALGDAEVAELNSSDVGILVK
jgi:hypothetical protein